MEICLPQNAPYSLIAKAVAELKVCMGRDKEYPKQKIKVSFFEETEVVYNRYHRKRLKEMYVNFFESADGYLCYTFYRRTGAPLSYIAHNIKSLAISKGDSPDNTQIVEVKSSLKLFTPTLGVTFASAC